jgi:hypothetical protein
LIAAAAPAFGVVPDLSIGLGALVVGRAVDELTGAPPPDRVTVSARLDGVEADVPVEAGGLTIATGDGGAFALAGLPERAFPDLGVTPSTIEMTLRCPGFLSTPVTLDLPAGSGAFPVELPDSPLRRPAVLLRGRVVAADVAAAPVAGASVDVVAPEELIGLGAPLSFPHDAGTGVVPVELAPVGPGLDLLADVAAGATELGLARRDGLAAGAVLELGDGLAREYAVVTAVEGPADPSLPGAVTFRAPLAFPHRGAEGPGHLVVEGAAGAAAALTSAAFAEDQVAFVDDPATLPDGEPVRVDDADAARVEFLVARRARASSDTGGYYRLGPIGRTSTVTVHVTPPAGPPPADVVHIVSHGTPENVLNLRA